MFIRNYFSMVTEYIFRVLQIKYCQIGRNTRNNETYPNQPFVTAVVCGSILPSM